MAQAIEVLCHDCGAKEGQLHKLGCDMERCPFCGCQLIICGCAYKHLGLLDQEKYTVDTSFLPLDVFENGLTDEQEVRWKQILDRVGRVPYIRYPVLCVKCGKLEPDFFSVSDEEWRRYIQIDMRDKVICKPCFNYIKAVIDSHGQEGSE